MPTHLMLGQTHVGKLHAENQDAILTRKIVREGPPYEIQLIGVADGISGSLYGGSVARWLMRGHFDGDAVFPEGVNDIGTQFASFLRGLHAQFIKEFADIPDMLSSGAALSVACLWDDSAICAWSGDCPVFLTIPQYGKLTTRQVSIADSVRGTRALSDCFGAHAPFSFKQQAFSVPHGGIVTIASDGAQSDEFTLNDLYQKKPFNALRMQEVINTARKYPRCDDVSIVACKRE